MFVSHGPQLICPAVGTETKWSKWVIQLDFSNISWGWKKLLIFSEGTADREFWHLPCGRSWTPMTESETIKVRSRNELEKVFASFKFLDLAFPEAQLHFYLWYVWLLHLLFICLFFWLGEIPQYPVSIHWMVSLPKCFCPVGMCQGYVTFLAWFT